MTTKTLMNFGVLGIALTAGSIQADRLYYHNIEADNNWTNANNWIYYKSNPVRTGIPGEADEARLQSGSVLKITTAVTVGYLKVGIYGHESVIIDGGSLVTLGTSDYNSACHTAYGSLVVQSGGSATFNSRFRVGGSNEMAGVMVVHDGTVRVASSYTHNADYSGTDEINTRTTLYPGGLLDVDEMILNAGVVDIAGGTLIIRRHAVYLVDQWIADGRMIAMGGQPGWKLNATFDPATGWTTIVAEPMTEPFTIG